MKKLRKFVKWLFILIVILYLGAYIYYNYFIKNKVGCIATKNYVTEITWTPFRWSSDENTDRAALYIPLHIDTIQQTVYAQFDLGIQRTLITSFTKAYPYLRKYAVEDKYKDLPIYLGNNERHLFTQNKMIDYGKEKPEDFIPKDSNDIVKVGDIGFDYIKGRIFICDFVKNRYALVDELPQNFDRQIHWINSTLVKTTAWPIHLPIVINGKERSFFYDNGSSMFTILTTKSYWREITNNGDTHRDSLKLTSWGEYFNYVRAQPKQKITNVLGDDLSDKKIFYTDRMNDLTMMLWNHFEGITGLMGNEYFRNNVLIIDTKTNRAGFYEEAK
jgi:hypothetical protein